VLRLVLATRNKHKVSEISAILADAGAPVELVGLENFPGAPEVDETGETLEENAVLKARSAADFTGLAAAADDTGLFVDALGGEPGVKAARYSGEGATYESNNKKLLAALADVPPEKRTAKFSCVVALIVPGRPPLTFRGELPGKIIAAPRGTNGSGYDPIFVPDGSGPTFAEMESGEKNRISHRSAAFRRLAAFLKSSKL
jgi:XTP/dITP diphosphohydrolase